MPNKLRTHGLTIVEVLITTLVLGLLLAIVVPVIARARFSSGVIVSMNNLANLGVAHQMYGADWNGRQATVIVDDFSTYGSSGGFAVSAFHSINGFPHPSLQLGFCNAMWAYSMSNPNNWVVITPLDFASGIGYFRIANSRALHTYVNGRFYDDAFYGPNDAAVYPLVQPLFSNPCAFVLVSEGANPLYWTSYCTSPAAMFHPDVMRAPSAGGWQNPFSLTNGFASPSLSQALYPNLKTHMLEHHWNQSPPPNVCNPAFPQGTYDGCEPYYFNHALASAPATLFYDGHVRLLPNSEVIAADAQIMKQSGNIDGLWSRDTPLGVSGYFGNQSYDGTIVSHHILTTKGILGRDTVTP